MHHFSTLDAVGSHLHVADKIVTRITNYVVITKTRSLYFEVLCVPECCMLCCKLSPWTLFFEVISQILSFEVSCPTDTLLPSKLFPTRSSSKLSRTHSPSTFCCPPLTYSSTLNNQRRINTPLVTQSLWEPQEANSAQYTSCAIISLITRLDHSNPSSSVATAYRSYIQPMEDLASTTALLAQHSTSSP